jgi:hypothetical protein
MWRKDIGLGSDVAKIKRKEPNLLVKVDSVFTQLIQNFNPLKNNFPTSKNVLPKINKL